MDIKTLQQICLYIDLKSPHVYDKTYQNHVIIENIISAILYSNVKCSYLTFF